uniref:Uncharacterized protein n=1 Tax=Arundo donax TaxID=35708 RepID=A0A0A9H7G4_ARUDO
MYICDALITYVRCRSACALSFSYSVTLCFSHFSLLLNHFSL